MIPADACFIDLVVGSFQTNVLVSLKLHNLRRALRKSMSHLVRIRHYQRAIPKLMIR